MKDKHFTKEILVRNVKVFRVDAPNEITREYEESCIAYISWPEGKPGDTYLDAHYGPWKVTQMIGDDSTEEKESQ